VIWATGIAPDFSCLDAPTFDRRGRLVHDGGATRLPGLYVLGLPVLRRRRSSLIDGAAGDTAVVIEHLHQHLRACVSPVPAPLR
jgi:putative flavoprotein involved in K+ transport